MKIKSKYRIYQLFVLSVVFLIVLLAIGPRINTEYSINQVNFGDNVEAFIKSSEKQYSDIIPGTEKKIIWANSETKAQTEYSLVYLHGFSATRQEIAPLCDKLAAQFSFNLFYTRLTGHGRPKNAMKQVSVNTLINDTEESVAIGKKIGKKVVLIGTSTGASLASWIAARNDETIAAIILLSPNFGLKRKESELLLYPWGKILLDLLVGEEYSFKAANAIQEKFWTTRYPSEAIMGMMGIVHVARNSNLEGINIPALVVYDENDKVVSTEQIKSQFQRFSSKSKQLVTFNHTTDPYKHILAGDALSPGTNDQLLKIISEFLKSVIQETDSTSDTVQN